MATFDGVGLNLGYTASPNPFMMVPSGGIGLLMLHQGQGYKVRAADSRLKLDELSKKEVSPVIRDFVFRFCSGPDSLDVIKKLWAFSHNSVTFGSRLFMVKASRRGLSAIEARKGRDALKVAVAIVPPKRFSVSFRFMQHPNGSGGFKRPTIWSSDQAKSMIEKVNTIFTPQVNIAFDLEDAEWITVSPEIHQPVVDVAFKNYVLPHKSKSADVTVFLVGRWKGIGTHPNGTYFAEQQAIVVGDKPSHPPVERDPLAVRPEIQTEPFILTLAHELAHHVQHTRKLGGHHDRENVLLSTGIQTAKMDKQLVADLNPW